MLYQELSYKVLGAAFTVHSSVGPGLLEKIYHKAMEVEFDYLGIEFQTHTKHDVFHREVFLGEFESDLIICDKIIIDVKAAKAFNETMMSQIINYMHITKMPVGYLINFKNKSVEYKRFILSEFA